MPMRAWLYLGIVLLLGASIAGSAILTLPDQHMYVPLALVLTILGTAAHILKVEAPNHKHFYATPAFWFAGIILLPPALVVMIIPTPLVIEWVKERWQNSSHLRPWYLQPFNIAMYLIAGMSAHLVYASITAHAPLGSMSVALGLVAAASSYVLVNQYLLGQALVLARHLTWRDTGVWNFDRVFPEFTLLVLGGIMAVLWPMNAWLVPLILLPVGVMYQSLLIPKLKEEAQTDNKTGQLNARYLDRAAKAEFERAQCFNRPLAIIMADLDYLRNINNAYGHFAGDIVLQGIAKVIRRTIREYDIAGRFGGEEFTIVMPETSQHQGYALAERVRRAIETERFVVPTSPTPINVTMSLGVACFPDDATTLSDLIKEADAAVYQAKHQGRNRVVSASDVTHVIKLEHEIKVGKHRAVTDQGVSAMSPTTSSQQQDTQNESASADRQKEDATVMKSSVDQSISNPVAAQIHDDQPRAQRHMSTAAWVYISSVLIASLGLSVAAFMTMQVSSSMWIVLAVLASLATVAQLNRAEGPNHVLFYANPVFFFAGVLLLPPFLLILLVVIPLTIEWCKERWRRSKHLQAWYLQPFNIGMYIIAGLTSQWLYRAIDAGEITNATPTAILRLIGAITVYTFISNAILGQALVLGRGVSWRESRVLAPVTLLPECIMAGLGVVVATLWQSYPWLITFALLPLLLIYRALTIPKLQAENMAQLQRVNAELSQANNAIQELNDDLFLTLAKIFDARDPYVGGHAAQVGAYAVAIGTELGLPTERIDLLRQCGYLHDIGKMAIPEVILHKPAKLSDEEFAIMKTHAAVGADFLETSKGLRHLAPFVRYHHERWDGRGYPSGLHGEQIPLESRILNICDSVEAMASDRPYHKGMTLDAIMAEVRRCSGSQFDPMIVEVFIRLAEREREKLIVNSAHEVERKQGRHVELSLNKSAMLFANIYHQAS